MEREGVTLGDTPSPPVGMDPMIPGFYYPLLPPADPAYQLQNRGHRAPLQVPPAILSSGDAARLAFRRTLLTIQPV